jgi:hypothetical protein
VPIPSPRAALSRRGGLSFGDAGRRTPAPAGAGRRTGKWQSATAALRSWGSPCCSARPRSTPDPRARTGARRSRDTRSDSPTLMFRPPRSFSAVTDGGGGRHVRWEMTRHMDVPSLRKIPTTSAVKCLVHSLAGIQAGPIQGR